MSKYRNIVAIALVALMVLSIYSLVSSAFSKSSEVQTHLQEAQKYAADGLLDKAAEKYSLALAIESNIEYYIRVSDMYYEGGVIDTSIDWAEKAISAFPNDPTGYARAIRGMMAENGYKQAFQTLETYDGRKLYSEEVEKYRTQMNSLHYLSLFSVEGASQPSNGYCNVYKNELWGIATVSGKTFLKPAYSKVGYFANGIVALCDVEGTWFFANSDGQLVKNITNSIEGKIDEVGLYNNGLFPVSNGSTWTYYDTDFKAHMGGYDFAGPFNGEVAAVRNGDSWSLIDTKGNMVTSVQYGDVVVDHRGVCCLQDTIIVNGGNGYILLDASGKQIGKASFEAAKLPAGGEYIAVKQNGKWGFADLEGNIVIEPQYEDARSFANGYAAVCMNGLWGFIDTTNTLCVEPQFVSCTDMTTAGTAFVENALYWQILKLYSKNY